MARPRKVSDDDVYAATLRVMSRVGPGQLTLAEIADEAGVTAGALVQRFGSKRELLVRLAGLLGSGMSAFFAALRAQHESPLAVVRAYAECMADMAKTPAALLRNFAYLQVDLTDPDFFRNVQAHARSVRSGLRNLVEEAVEAGELRAGTDADALARALDLTVNGSLWSWAFHQEGTAADWMRHDIDALLTQYEAPRARVRRKK